MNSPRRTKYRRPIAILVGEQAAGAAGNEAGGTAARIRSGAARRAVPEPDSSAESTPTGGWCQIKQASIFTEILPNCYQNFIILITFFSIFRKHLIIFDQFTSTQIREI